MFTYFLANLLIYLYNAKKCNLIFVYVGNLF